MSDILQIKNLQLRFLPTLRNPEGVTVLRGLSYSVNAGKTLVIVGESGCGKTVSLLAALGLLGNDVEIKGEILFSGQSLLSLPQKAINKIRGHHIGMIFQDPMTALNPTMKVGLQIAEVLQVHKKLSLKKAKQKAINLLHEMGLADADLRAEQYPFEFSGGMLQRAAIAIAIAAKPKLILADEPTTALDVTIQKQVLHLIKQLQQEQGSALVLVTHDLSVVAEMADDVVVMYAGQVVEQAPLRILFEQAAHPYTIGLRKAQAKLQQKKQQRLIAIEGSPPDMSESLQGCAFKTRCSQAMKICESQPPPLITLSDTHQVKCWLYHPQYKSQQQVKVAV